MSKTAEELTDILDTIVAMTKSHIDGRDLLDEIHPRNTLDIKRRVDGVEKWFEADWLSGLRDAIKAYAEPKEIAAGHSEYLQHRLSEYRALKSKPVEGK